jgi:hypothetical protein
MYKLLYGGRGAAVMYRVVDEISLSRKDKFYVKSP